MRLKTLVLVAGLALTGPLANSPVRAAAPSKPAAGGKYDAAKLKALETKLSKSPKDAKLKLETAEANFEVGKSIEYNESLPPRARYGPALKYYRRALVLNPKLTDAAKEKKQIEDIYKQMGRPIPQ